MGRRVKDIEDLKTEKVEVRLTYEEKKHLMEICNENGNITLSNLIRIKLLGED